MCTLCMYVQYALDLNYNHISVHSGFFKIFVLLQDKKWAILITPLEIKVQMDTGQSDLTNLTFDSSKNSMNAITFSL